MSSFLFRLPRLALMCCAALVLGHAMPAQAQSFTDGQKDQIRSVIRDYLLQNPEILQEAMVELEKKQKDAEKAAQSAAMKDYSGALVNSPRNVVVGNPNGDVTLIEFFDYNCGYCKRAMNDLREMIKADPKLRVVLRDFPVLGPDSVEASLGALAAKNQIKPEKFWEFHQKLLDQRGRIGKEKVIAVAKEFGADPAKIEKDMQSPEVRAAIEETMRIADALKLQGTPAFIVGNEIIFGAVGEAPLKAAVASVRKCGKAAC
jgi:protein-disulfide isomerase